MDVSVNESLTALELRGLVKCFDRPAVDGLELTIRAGEFYALLGPNGAGKTTTLRIVAGLLKPDVGSVSALTSSRRCSLISAICSSSTSALPAHVFARIPPHHPVPIKPILICLMFYTSRKRLYLL